MFDEMIMLKSRIRELEERLEETQDVLAKVIEILKEAKIIEEDTESASPEKEEKDA